MRTSVRRMLCLLTAIVLWAGIIPGGAAEEDGIHPRREEIIGYIREGLLPTPYNKSYNVADYSELVAEAEANRAAKGTDETQKNDP